MKRTWNVEYYTPLGKEEPKILMIYEDGFLIAHVNNEFTDDEGEKNAALIAIAPELLEALEALLKDFEYMARMGGYKPEDFELIKQARAAIAKTRGDNPERGNCLTCGELIPQGCCTCGPRRRIG